MKTYPLSPTNFHVSRIAYGCMNLGHVEDKTAADLVAGACAQGINFFDHADIYAGGKSEAVFGRVLQQSPGLRDRIILQSKCGIRGSNTPQPGDPGRYDFSYEHITNSVNGSLQRLQTDHLDILLLHRPDALAEPAEVARAFHDLQRAGKVQHFGVSNHTGAQVALLQKYLDQPLVANQLQLSLLHAHLIDDGVAANISARPHAAAGGTLDDCRLHNILVQAWSPLDKGKLIAPPADAEPHIQTTAALVSQLATAHGVSREAIALAWLLRHPAGIQPIVGTTKIDRLIAGCQADAVALSREEWYHLFIAARGAALP